MTTQPFQGLPSILALSCSGRVLSPDTKLMALVLFTAHRHSNNNNHNNNHRPANTNNNNNNNHRPANTNTNNDNDDNNNDSDNDNSNIVASMDLIDGECYTSDSFSSCDIRARDAKGSAVKTLVMGLREGESRRFGCEVSSRRTGGRTQVYSWFVDVRRNRE